MRRNSLWVLLVVLLAALFAAGCATAPAPAAPAAAGEPAAAPAASGEPLTLRLATVSQPSTLDPNLAQDYYSITPIEQMFLGLTNLNNVTSEIEPELAESWAVSDDGTVWTFKLRQDATWSDGKPVTAKDVEYSVKRAVKPETASPYAFVLYSIKNAAAINQTVIPTGTYDIDALGVKALDDYTVEFTLAAPAPYFESISSMWTLRPVPSWAIEQYGDAWTEPANIVVNGPYKLVEWRPGEKLVYEKNPSYFKADEVQIDRVEMSLITDQFTEVALYEAGDLDIAGESAASLPAEEVARIHGRSDLERRIPSGSTCIDYLCGLHDDQAALRQRAGAQGLLRSHRPRDDGARCGWLWRPGNPVCPARHLRRPRS